MPVVKRMVIGVVLALVGVAASAEQLTTVAVIDITRVYNSFYRDSRQVRDLENLREQYQSEIESHQRDLERLEDRRSEAEERGDEERVEELDQQILEQRRFLQDLATRRQRQLDTREESLLSDEFLQQLLDAIEFVAESEGYTVVLRRDTDGLQWWSSAVDISDLVLDRLRQTTGG
ncbi:MAG: OmpH family outer membrane protein [Spirochaetaceae bacterium]